MTTSRVPEYGLPAASATILHKPDRLDNLRRAGYSWINPPSRFGGWEKGRPWTAFLHFGRLMTTNVYIDGFNFYYGCLKRTAFKWLDYGAFCRASLPNDTINHIRYFTALVSADDDPDSPVRQLAYLRALETVPNLSIHQGRFFRVTKKGKLVDPLIPDLDRVTIRT